MSTVTVEQLDSHRLTCLDTLRQIYRQPQTYISKSHRLLSQKSPSNMSTVTVLKLFSHRQTFRQSTSYMSTVIVLRMVRHILTFRQSQSYISTVIVLGMVRHNLTF